jgi:hypothetical protein
MGYYIDGSNIACYAGKEKPTIDALLTLLVEIEKRGGKFSCLFDANIERVIFGGNQPELAIICSLLKDSNRFLKCPKSRQADEYILEAAKKFQTRIITNDSYTDYKEKHPWIINKNILTQVVKLKNPDDDNFYLIIPELKINIPVQRNLEQLLIDLGLSMISSQELEKEISYLSKGTHQNTFVKQNQENKSKGNLTEPMQGKSNSFTEIPVTDSNKKIVESTAPLITTKKKDPETISKLKSGGKENGVDTTETTERTISNLDKTQTNKVDKRTAITKADFSLIKNNLRYFNGEISEYKKLSIHFYNIFQAQEPLRTSNKSPIFENDFNNKILKFSLNSRNKVYTSLIYIRRAYISGLSMCRNETEIMSFKKMVVRKLTSHVKQIANELKDYGIFSEENRTLLSDRVNSEILIEFIERGADGKLPEILTFSRINDLASSDDVDNLWEYNIPLVKYKFNFY